MIQVGFTEQGDAALDSHWKKWVYDAKLPAVLITKNPKKLIQENPKLFFGDNLEGNVILHATITGLGGTVYEPNVPKAKDTISYFREILKDEKFHKERIVIREDPIIPAFAVQNKVYRKNMIDIAKLAVENNLRYRMSFFDYYPHVRARFEEMYQHEKDLIEKYNSDSIASDMNTIISEIDYLNYIQPELHLALDLRMVFLDNFKNNSGLKDTVIEICGEPGFKCTGCLSQKDLDIFGIELEKDVETGYQRPACACLGLKKELLSNKHPCGHNCLYCYWKD